MLSGTARVHPSVVSSSPVRGADVQLVLIASAGHSGSTLLDLLLGSHSVISGSGEMNRLSLYPDDRVCACGSAVGRCPYWNRIRLRVADALGRDRLRWDECHTDVPPLDAVQEIDDSTEQLLVAGESVPSRIAMALAAKGITLSPEARLAHGGVRDVKWRLVDAPTGTSLVLRREDGRLKIYPRLVEWKNPLRRIPSLLEVALALGAERGVRWLARMSSPTSRALDAARKSWWVAEAMAAEDGTRLVVDSSKSAIRLKLLYVVRPERVRVVHLVRDGRAVAASAMRRRDITAATAARLWKRENQHLALVLRGIPAAQKHRVRYEDLCADPSRELARICAFLDVEFEPAMVHFWDRPVHNIPGNPMLFEKSRRAIATDERWRRDLSPEQVGMIERIAGRLNRSFGYS